MPGLVGGLTTKIYLVCNSYSLPLNFLLLSPGQHVDSRYLIPVLEQIRLPGLTGRPRKRCYQLLADQGYDSDGLRQYCDWYGMRPTIRHWQMHRRPRPGLPRLFERPRYDKLAKSYCAMVMLVCIKRCLRVYFSEKA